MALLLILFYRDLSRNYLKNLCLYVSSILHIVCEFLNEIQLINSSFKNKQTKLTILIEHEIIWKRLQWASLIIFSKKSI